LDAEYLARIRSNVLEAQKEGLAKLPNGVEFILDIAPQVHSGVAELVDQIVDCRVETLDISSEFKPTYVGDLCTLNEQIPNARFDAVFCTEVLEHVNQPFKAIAEIYRVLKPGGLLVASSPFNFRIHGPLPDNWRFSEHGWRVLLSEFNDIEIIADEDKHRYLMPIHYVVYAHKPIT
jgi:SAM-dependent methyltransferase